MLQNVNNWKAYIPSLYIPTGVVRYNYVLFATILTYIISFGSFHPHYQYIHTCSLVLGTIDLTLLGKQQKSGLSRREKILFDLFIFVAL